uniref:DPP IV N-terminal domain-containing protein n=1 Tax=Alistipes sp. TaxID=1872444 RepID=UPI0040565D81
MKSKKIYLLLLMVGLLLPTLASPLGELRTRAKAAYDHYSRWSQVPSPGMVVPMADGAHYTRIQGDAIERVRYSDGLCDTLFLGEKGSGARISAYEVAADGGLLISYGAHPIYRHSFSVDSLLYFCDQERKLVASEVADKRDATLSPDGRKVLFSSQNNLYLYDLDRATTLQLTHDGAWNQIINGTTDWVYEEEFGFTKGFAFSPDSRKVAFLRFDESEVPLFEMMRFDCTLYNKAYTFKYPKAGDRNATVTLWVADLEHGDLTQIDTGEEWNQYIPNLGWTPSGELYFYRVDRRQRLFEVVVEKSDMQQIIYSESSPRYVERPIGEVITFIDEDRFVVREETTTGWWHLYLHSMERGRLKTLTSGQWEVVSLVHADKRGVWYTSTERGASRRDLYRVDLRGKNKVRLTESDGWHAILASADMSYFIDSFSSASIPTTITLRDGMRGLIVRLLSTSDSPAHEAVRADEVPLKEFFTFTNAEGTAMNAWVVYPKDFDPTKRYPVLLTQYSGPGSQEVYDRWRPDWTEALALEGYIVACLDPRGTGYMGEAFKKQTYGDLGRREVEDQIAFARHWAEKPFVDASRVGIYGWSYGGFMALSCALKGDGLFKMAIAVAPVTSWRYYDSVYTETYNGLPEEFAAGYDENSPLNFADRLSPDTRLLLIHGSGDDNVHLQNTMEMARRLNACGAQYDMMIYPDQNHSMMPDDRHNVRIKMIGYTLENL